MNQNGLGRLFVGRGYGGAPRAPLPGAAQAGGTGTIYVYDQENRVLAGADVFLMRVERGSFDTREQITGQRVGPSGAMFALPAIASDEQLVYVVDAPGFARGMFTARPGLTVRAQLARERGGFSPEAIVMQTTEVFGLGSPDLSDLEFLKTVAAALGLAPAEAGELTRLWQDDKDEFARALARRAGMGAVARASLPALVAADDREGIVRLVEDETRSFWATPAFYVPAGFFALSYLVSALRKAA